jgi:hypothetical protein
MNKGIHVEFCRIVTESATFIVGNDCCQYQSSCTLVLASGFAQRMHGLAYLIQVLRMNKDT